MPSSGVTKDSNSVLIHNKWISLKKKKKELFNTSLFRGDISYWLQGSIWHDTTNIHLGVGVRRVSTPSVPRLLPLPEWAPGSWLCKGFTGPAKDSGYSPALPLFHKDLSFCCRQMLSLVLEERRKWILLSRLRKLYTPIPNKRKPGHQFLEGLHLLGGGSYRSLYFQGRDHEAPREKRAECYQVIKMIGHHSREGMEWVPT